jgi:hypothetical protein
MIRTVLVIAGCLIFTPTIYAGPIGEFGGSVGVILPQGNFTRYSDPGFNAVLRFNLHPRPFPIASTWVDGCFSAFGSDESAVLLEGSSVAIPAKQSVSEYAASIHAGLQLGSWTRRGFFRPRAALAPGLYFFNTETSIRPLDYDEDIYNEVNTQLRVGWRGIVGLDLFFNPKWGISLDFVYDQVLSLHHVNESDDSGNVQTTSQSARFQAFMIGAVVDFDLTE